MPSRLLTRNVVNINRVNIESKICLPLWRNLNRGLFKTVPHPSSHLIMRNYLSTTSIDGINNGSILAVLCTENVKLGNAECWSPQSLEAQQWGVSRSPNRGLAVPAYVWPGLPTTAGFMENAKYKKGTMHCNKINRQYLVKVNFGSFTENVSARAASSPDQKILKPFDTFRVFPLIETVFLLLGIELTTFPRILAHGLTDCLTASVCN